MKALANDPRLLRWVIALLIGVLVALVVSASFPERQGSQFVPFVVTALIAFTIVWLIAIGVERWATRRVRESERGRRR